MNGIIIIRDGGIVDKIVKVVCCSGLGGRMVWISCG
jgi:hypothetical protein